MRKGVNIKWIRLISLIAWVSIDYHNQEKALVLR